MTNLDVKVDGVAALPVQPSDLFPCRSYPAGIGPLCIEAEEAVDEDINRWYACCQDNLTQE
jgi:hypothetical protein